MPSIEVFVKNRFLKLLFKFKTTVASTFFITFALFQLKHLFYIADGYIAKSYDLAVLCGNLILTFKLLHYNLNRKKFEKIFDMFDNSLEGELFLDQRMVHVFSLLMEEKKSTNEIILFVFTGTDS